MKRHVIISGTGRAGTSFLVTLLTHLGLDTGFTPASLRLHRVSRAGLEHDIRKKNAPYIVKSPHLCSALPELLNRGDLAIDHAIVPVRRFADAAASRNRVQGGLARQVPGGLWLTADGMRQQEILERQFTSLFEALAQHDIPVTLLWFPRLVTDCEYLFRHLEWLLKGIDFPVFQTMFAQTTRPDWVHDFAKPRKFHDSETTPRARRPWQRLFQKPQV